jgi:DNA-binding transcriptional MerR regulator
MSKNKSQLLNITQVAKIFDLIGKKNKKPSIHILRFWEKKFKQLKPVILPGGRRYYSENNLKVIEMIIFLLKDQGLTINGAIKMMNIKLKKLDDTKAISIKGEYYKKKITDKSKNILLRIKKLNGKKNSHQS